jgi:hypothetical protein
MFNFLRSLSAFFFYVLAATFFVAYLLLRNNIFTSFGIWPAWWLQVADLPLALSAILYAGLSFYSSMRSGKGHSRVLAWVIALPLAAFFILLLVFDFWPS